MASVLHRAPVVSQCTTKHCHDDGRDMGAPTALVDRLQDTVEQQQDSLEQQQREMATLKQTVALQEKQLTRLEESMYSLTTRSPSGRIVVILPRLGNMGDGYRFADFYDDIL